MMIVRFFLIFTAIFGWNDTGYSQNKQPVIQYMQYLAATLEQEIHQFPPYISGPLLEKMHQNTHNHTSQAMAASLLTNLTHLLSGAMQISIHTGVLHHQPVDYISIGYLIFYAISKISNQSFIWNKTTVSWDPLTDHQLDHLRVFWRIKQQYQSNAWVTLPTQLFQIKTQAQIQESLISPARSLSNVVFSAKESAQFDCMLSHCYQHVNRSTLYFLFPVVTQWSNQTTCHALYQLLSVFYKMMTIHEMTIPDTLKAQWFMDDEEVKCIFMGCFFAVSEMQWLVRNNDDVSKPVKSMHDVFDLNLLLIMQAFHQNVQHDWIPFISQPYDFFIGNKNLGFYFQWIGCHDWIIWVISLFSLIVLSFMIFRIIILLKRILRLRLYQRKYKKNNLNPRYLMQALLIESNALIVQTSLNRFDFLRKLKEKYAAYLKQLYYINVGLFSIASCLILGYSLSHYYQPPTPIIMNILCTAIVIMIMMIFVLLCFAIYRLLIQYYLWKLENVSWHLSSHETLYLNHIDH
ncbi:MAG: hypothetical protein HAW62_02210 [Endozoicomonadaceae bacterium]|nr:hypothetical protein [Endozoicomonadaceae bacterium]